MIRQGDVVWVDFPPARDSSSAGRRPAVVVQHDRYNRSAIATVIVAAITSHVKYAALPGNVRLRRGEAGLDRSSVVNVTQVATIDRASIVRRSGSLAARRVAEIRAGLRHVMEPPPQE